MVAQVDSVHSLCQVEGTTEACEAGLETGSMVRSCVSSLRVMSCRRRYNGTRRTVGWRGSGLRTSFAEPREGMRESMKGSAGTPTRRPLAQVQAQSIFMML